MTQQPGQGWPQEDPYASGAQPQGYPQAPAYPQAPVYPQPQAYAAGGYAPGYLQPLPPLAHWGKRVAALLLDNLLVAVVFVPAIVFAITTAEVVGYDRTGAEVTEPTGAGVVALVVAYGGGFVIQLWNRWIRQGRTGQSLGKQVMGIRLVSERTMAPIGAGMAFARDLCHVVDGFFYLGYLWPLWDAKRQTFSDKILGTVVLDG